MSDLRIPIAYDNWATETLVDFCLGLTPQQLELTTPGTMGTVKATLIHLVAAKERYGASLAGSQAPAEAIRETTTTDLGPVKARSKVLSGFFDEFAGGTIDLDATIERRAADGTVQKMPMWVLLAQFLHHGNEHRAQLGSIFGAHGIEAPGYSAFNWAQSLGKFA
ncbi:MAG: DinB family protein [Chloroflexota bacterium]